MDACTNHPTVKALSVCHGCGKPYCKSCLDEGKDFYYCKKPSCQELFRLENARALLPPRVNCPRCSSELELSDGDRASKKFHCPECDAFLDFTVDPPIALDNKDYTEVFSSMNQGHIALLKSILDDAGLDYYVTGEYFLATDPLIQPAKFYVLNDQVTEAREIVKKFSANLFTVTRRKDLSD